MSTAPRKTHGMDNLLNQINARFPNRDKWSDGWIGDAAHQREASGHNPDDTPGVTAEWNGDADSTPEVRAIDVDSDLRDPGGITAQDLVDHITGLPGVSAALRYVIYNRRIYQEQTGFAATSYTGESAHTEHIHFSGAYSQAGDESTFNYHLDQLGADMPLTDDDVQKIASKIGADLNTAASGIAKGVRAQVAVETDELYARLDEIAAAVAALTPPPPAAQ